MKYRLARAICVSLAALSPACGGGDFVGGGVITLPDGSTDGGVGDAATASGGADSSGGTAAVGGGAGHSGGAGGRGSGGRAGGTGGKGGTASSGGDAGVTDTGSGGAAGDSGGSESGGAQTDGGTSGDGGALGNGGTHADGGTPNTGGSCTNPSNWYLDDDGDGYGSLALGPTAACESPGSKYTLIGGDCNDGNRDVHPQLAAAEKKFFDIAYKTAGGAISFDYDCSGVEEGEPKFIKAGTCTFLTLGNVCGGSGYKATTRAGAGVDPYCGSQNYQTCKGTLTCAGTVTTNASPYTCR